MFCLSDIKYNSHRIVVKALSFTCSPSGSGIAVVSLLLFFLAAQLMLYYLLTLFKYKSLYKFKKIEKEPKEHSPEVIKAK